MPRLTSRAIAKATTRMTHRSLRRRPLRLEGLEGRELMAADFAPGELLIQYASGRDAGRGDLYASHKSALI